MSLMRRKRLEALGSASPARGRYLAPGPAVGRAMFEVIELNAAAVRAGRAEWRPLPEPAEPETPALAMASTHFDRLTKRLAENPA
jgi:hypothetical protein